jgi:hypothetical protein
MPPDAAMDPDKNPLRIARAVEALLADHDRQGYVTDDQVIRAGPLLDSVTQLEVACPSRKDLQT